MKKFIPLLLLSLLALSTTLYAQKRDELSLNISLTRGEHSRDSHSQTTKITLQGRELVYEKSSTGFRAREPVKKSFTVSDEDIAQLKKLIREQNLLVTDTLAVALEPGGGFRTYFKINVQIELDGQKSAIAISGPRRDSGIKEKNIYRQTNALLEAVYKIINEQDADIGYENRGLVN